MRRTLALAALLAACGILDPDYACSCPPGLLTTPVSGEVVNASGSRVVGARIVAESAPDNGSVPSGCVALGGTLVGIETVAAADGSYATVVRWPGGPACARVFAYVRTGTQTVVSDTAVFPLDPQTPGTPWQNVVLTFAATP